MTSTLYPCVATIPPCRWWWWWQPLLVLAGGRAGLAVRGCITSPALVPASSVQSPRSQPPHHTPACSHHHHLHHQHQHQQQQQICPVSTVQAPHPSRDKPAGRQELSVVAPVSAAQGRNNSLLIISADSSSSTASSPHTSGPPHSPGGQAAGDPGLRSLLQAPGSSGLGPSLQSKHKVQTRSTATSLHRPAHRTDSFIQHLYQPSKQQNRAKKTLTKLPVSKCF